MGAHNVASGSPLIDPGAEKGITALSEGSIPTAIGKWGCHYTVGAGSKEDWFWNPEVHWGAPRCSPSHTPQ